MKVGISANPSKPAAVELARRAVEHLTGRADLEVSEELPTVAPSEPHRPLEALRPDVLLAIGGDGTFLYTLRRSSVPLLPVNAGTVGILAEVDGGRPDEFDLALERLLDGRYYLEDRMKLAAEIGRRPLPDAVNEYVLHAAHVGKMGLFDIAVDRRPVGRVQADGIIVATPTGSTGYSLSSLGPIVDPGLNAIVVTTIAPFRVEARAVVIDPIRTVRLRAADAGHAAVVIVDGQDQHPLPPDGTVTIYRSPRRAVLVRFGSRFYERLRGKRILPWSEEPPVSGGDGADLPPPT